MHAKQLKWVFFILIFVAFCIAIILWLKPKTSYHSDTSAISSSNHLALTSHTAAMQPVNVTLSAGLSSLSQQDTQVNCQIKLDHQNNLIVNAQTRDCFEYFITQLGEKNLQQIKTDFASYIDQHYPTPAKFQLKDLWQRYVDYREALGDLNNGQEAKDELSYYQQLFNATQNLRQRFFSKLEIDQLFGEEDIYHQYTLSRAGILDDKSLNEAQKAQQLKNLADQLPKEWQDNLQQLSMLENLNRLTADLKAKNASSNQIRQMRINLVGEPAANRLEALDQVRANWQSRTTDYLTARDTILQSSMSDSAKTQAISQLRQQQFPQQQEQLRVSTFESIHDKGGNLPFAP